MEAENTRRLIGVDELTKKLNIPRRTLLRYAHLGLIPTGVKIGRLRRWDEAKINEWIEAGSPRVSGGRYGS